MSRTESGAGRRQDLAFFGAVSAGLSHEINNALAVINELAGLISDLAAAAGQGKPLDPERVGQVVGRIAARVEDGKAFVKQLNRFAHSVDQPRARLDAGASLEQAAGLCQRFARLQKVELRLTPAPGPLPVDGGPFDLLQVLFRTIEAALGSTAPGTSLVVGLEPEASGLVVVARGPGRQPPDAQTATRIELLGRLAEALGGGLTRPEPAGGEHELRLALPAALGALDPMEEG